MNVTGKLMHMDCIVGREDGEDGVELLIVGFESRFDTAKKSRIEMTATVRAPREVVADYKLGDKFDLNLSRINRDLQFNPNLDPELQRADPYQLGADRMEKTLMSLFGKPINPKAMRDSFKESFFMAIKIRLQDPEFRDQLKRDIEEMEKLRP